MSREEYEEHYFASLCNMFFNYTRRDLIVSRVDVGATLSADTYDMTTVLDVMQRYIEAQARPSMGTIGTRDIPVLEVIQHDTNQSNWAFRGSSNSLEVVANVNPVVENQVIGGRAISVNRGKEVIFLPY